MSLTVSNTFLFDLSVDELINTAGRRAMGEKFQGIDAKYARISLNLLFIDLQNRKLPLCTVKERTLSLVQGQRDYALPAEVLAVLDGYWRDSSGVDIALEQIGVLDYAAQCDKDSSSQPVQFCIQNNQSGLKAIFWPIPDQATTFYYWTIDKIDDVSASYQKVNISSRYLPAVVAGLAYFLAMDRDDIPEDKLARLKAQYDEFLTTASEFDSETVDIRIVPSIRGA